MTYRNIQFLDTLSQRKQCRLVWFCSLCAHITTAFSGSADPADLIGEPVPYFEFRTTTGEQLQSPQFLNKVWLIDFWPVGFQSNTNDVAILKRLVESHEETGLVVLGILDEQTLSRVQNLQETLPAGIRLTTERQRLAKRLGHVGQSPTQILVDRHATVQEVTIGELNESKTTNDIVALLEGQSLIEARQLRMEQRLADIVGRIPPRDPVTSPWQLDLGTSYNALLGEDWYPEFVFSNERVGFNLSSLPSGFVELGGVFFDVRGIVQLTGRAWSRGRESHFPVETPPIPVNREFEKLHLLHGTGYHCPVGTIIARVRIDYLDRTSFLLPIIYGRHVQSWRETSNQIKEEQDSVLAWSGASQRDDNKKLSVYRSTFPNPLPNQTVKEIRIISAMEWCVPFIVSATIE